MSTEKINIDGLNNFNFQLGPSVNYKPEQELPELYFTATAPVMFGRSFFNNWQTLTAPFTFNTLEGAEAERYGVMPDTNLQAISSKENWSTKKPNNDDFWEFRKANYLLTGGAGSGFLGRDVDRFALERAKRGYWSGPYFKIQNPLIENMDQVEKDYNDYLNQIKAAKQAVKVNLGNDNEPVAYYEEGVPKTAEGKLAWSSSGGVDIKYDGKEIPSHVVPEPMTLEQFKERNKAFIDAGSISRWMLSTQAEGGYLSGNALVGALVDTAFDNPLYKNNLDDEYAKQSAIQLSLAKYNSGFDIFEQGVGSIADDLKTLIDKKDPNFDGAKWFNQLNLPKEVKETLSKKGVDGIDFIGTNNKDHALFILQDKVFKSTLKEKVEAYQKDSILFDNFAGDVIGFAADFFTTAINDPDLGIGIAATVATAGFGTAAKGGLAALKAAGYTNKAIRLQKSLQTIQKGLSISTAFATGELPSFMQKMGHLKRLSYIGGSGAVLNTIASAKDQTTRIAMSMTGLQTDHEFEYSKKELAIAGTVGFLFGTSLYGATQGLGKLKNKLFKKTDETGVARLETPEGTDAVVTSPTPLTKDAIIETATLAVEETKVDPITAVPAVEGVRTIDLDIEGTKYKFREDEIRKIDETAKQNTIENVYIRREDGIYEIPKLSLDEAKIRAVEVEGLPPVTGEAPTRLERIASDAEKAADSATIKEDGRAGKLGSAPESPIFNKVTGESTLDYGKRSIDANQIKDEKDWLRVVATAEDIKTIQAEPKPYLKIRKIKELATRSLDVLKQLKESGRTAKDSTWFTDQEINLNRHIADLQKLERDLIGKENKGFSTLSNEKKTQFLELAEKYKDVSREDFDRRINEEKNLNRKFRKALSEYLFGKEKPTETLKVKDTDSPLVRKLKQKENAILANRKTKPRSLNAAQTKKAQKAFTDISFAKKISPEHEKLINYFEKVLQKYFDNSFPHTDIKAAKELKEKTVKLIASAIANLKLNPTKLVTYLERIGESGVYGEALQDAGVREVKFGFSVFVNEILKGAEAGSLTPNQTAHLITKVALHELGHIYSFVLDIDQQIELYKAYSDYVDFDLVRFFTDLDNAVFEKGNLNGNFVYSFGNVAEFFANMFESLVYSKSVEAISKLENQSLLTRVMSPFFKFIKDVWGKLSNIIRKSEFNDLDNIINGLIETADEIDYRTVTNAASLGLHSFQVQTRLAQNLGKTFDGISYTSYIDSIFETLMEKASVDKPSKLLADIIAETTLDATSVREVQRKLLTRLYDGTLSREQVESLSNFVDSDIKDLIKDVITYKDDYYTNLLALSYWLIPDKVQELLQANYYKMFVPTGEKLTTNDTSDFIKNFIELSDLSDRYKAKSIAFVLPSLFEENITMAEMYRNVNSIVDFLKRIKNDKEATEVLQNKIGSFFVDKAYETTQTIAGQYLTQFTFFEDVLNNIAEYTGITIDHKLYQSTENLILSGIEERFAREFVFNDNIIVTKLSRNPNQPHGIKDFDTLINALLDTTTENSIIKYLLETYMKDTEVGKVFSLQPVFQRLETDKAFEAQLLNAAKENPDIDGFAKALSGLLVDEKKKKIKKERKLVEKVVEVPEKPKKFKSQMEQVKASLKEGEYIDDLTGKPYLDGQSEVEVLMFEPYVEGQASEEPYIVKTIAPVVRKDGKIVSRGTVIVREGNPKLVANQETKFNALREKLMAKIPEKQEEVKIPDTYITEDIGQIKDADTFVTMIGEVVTKTVSTKKEREAGVSGLKVTAKTKLGASIRKYLKDNWSGIKTESVEDLVQKVIEKILMNRDKVNAALSQMTTEKEKFNYAFGFANNVAKEAAVKQKRKAQKVSYGLVREDGKEIDIPDARIAVESSKPISKEQAENVLSIVTQTTLSPSVKDIVSKYLIAKQNNPEITDKGIAKLLGITDKQVMNAKAALRKQVQQIDGEIKLVNDEVRPTSLTENITETAKAIIAKKSDAILSGEEKPKVVSLEEARAKLEASRKIRTNIEAAVSKQTTELPVAMPEVKTEVGETVMFVSGETKDDSIKGGSVLLPEDKVTVSADKTEPIFVSTTKVKSTTRTLTLVLDKPDIISALEATPEERFSDFGLEKDILISIVKESETPETTLIDILKEQNIDLVSFMKKEKTVAVVPTKEGVVKKETTLDTTSRLPVIRKPTEPPVADDPKVIIDKPVVNPEKLPVDMDPKTGRTPATDPKIKAGKAETVVLNDVDKFDAQMMAGESLLRNSGTDPKFVKILLLNFHRITSGLRENLGKKIETIPDQFLHFLDKVYNIYSTISNINQEKFGTRFETINNIFWSYYDIEIAKELDARSTPTEQISVKTMDQILDFAKAKTDQAIASYNARYGTDLPEFTRPPSPHDFVFSADNITLNYPDKVRMKKGSYAAQTYAGAKVKVDIESAKRDLGLGVLIDIEPEKLPPTQGILINFLNNLATEHTEVFRSTNWIASLFRGSEKTNRNAFRKTLSWMSGLTSFATGEGKTLRSMNNLLRWLSSMAENGKVMTHQLVKSGTHAFKTWEGVANQVQRSKRALITLNRDLAIQTGDLRVMQAVELEIVKSLVSTKRPLQRADIQTAVLAINSSAQPAYIDAVFTSAKNLRDETIRRNKFILDLENSTEWISIKDDAGNPVPAENYFALTFDRDKVTKNDRTQIVDEMVRVRKDTIRNDETLDRSIMLAMGWLWDTESNPLTSRGKEGRDQLHIGETGFDADTLSRLEAKAGNRRYAPGTDLKKIPEIRREADTKFFSYEDPATGQIVICAIPEKVDDLSPRDLARYMETVDGVTTHIADQWKANFGNTKPVLQVMMEELLAFKLREGNYHRYIQKPEMGDNAFLQLFGKGGDNQGFAVKNLDWKEVFNSPLIKDIIRTNPLAAYDNLINHRGFELLVQAELDRMLGVKGVRIYELFDAASKLLMRMAGSNESLQKDLQGGMKRLAEDYAEYAGRNPRIMSAYGETGEQLSRSAGGILRATSGQGWGLRSTAESFINVITALPEVGIKETINNAFGVFKMFLDRRPSEALKQQAFLTVHGIRSYLSEIEDRYLQTNSVSGVPSLNDSWWKRLTKTREDSNKLTAALETIGNLGVEVGSVKYITGISKHFALGRFTQRNAKYIVSGAALRLLALMENPANKAELERLQALSITSEKADRQLAALQKKLAREAGFGGNWDHALTFMRFRLLDADKLKALKYIMEQTGTNKNGVFNLTALQAKVDAYMTGPIGPIPKEVLDEAFSDFVYALETQISTDGLISESRGLNKDISITSKTGIGRFIRSLLQWSQSFKSGVLENLQLKKPTVVLAEIVILYSALTYMSELIIDWLNGRDVKDIKEELKDPSTSVFRMASTLPVFGSLSGLFSGTLATFSELTGGTYKGFSNPVSPPAFSVLNAYVSKAMGSGKELLAKGGEMSKEEMIAKFGDIIPYNITFNKSPVAVPARLLQELEVIDENNSLNKYLKLIQKGKNKYINKPENVASNHNIVPVQSREIENKLKDNRARYLEETNKFLQDRKNSIQRPITYTNNKGVSTDLANLLKDMSNNQ